MALLWLRRDRIRWRRLAAGIAVFGRSRMAILWAAFPVFARIAWLRVSAAFEYFSESPNAVLSGRIDAWRTLADYLIANPWHALLGVGYKTLPYSDFIGAKAVGDNTYLTLLAETGIAGLFAVVALNIAILCMRVSRGAIVRLRSLVHRRLDVLFLGRAKRADALGRSAHLLASFAGVLFRARAGRAEASREDTVSRSVQRIGRRAAALLDTVDAVQRNGWQPHVLVPGRRPAGGSASIARSVRLARFRAVRIARDSKSAADSMRFALDLRRQVRVISDLISASEHRSDLREWPATYCPPRRWHRDGEAPVVFHVHSQLRGSALRLCAGPSGGRAATVIGCSNSVLAPLRHCEDRKQHVIPNGVRDAGYRERGFGSQRIHLADRNHWPHCSRERTDGIRGCGRDLEATSFPGPLCDLRRAAIWHAQSVTSRRCASERADLPVEFMGWQQDVGPVLSELDLLVVPSSKKAWHASCWKPSPRACRWSHFRPAAYRKQWSMAKPDS